MLVTTPADFLAHYSPERYPASCAATPHAAFLVAPNAFALAHESAQDNSYMRVGVTVDASRAAAQHATLCAALRDCLPTVVFAGDATAPDGIFPNNVFATVSGKLVIGAMRHAVRKREATRSDIRGFFRDLLHYEIVDLSTKQITAELTGALVIDRARGIGFCGLSERCDMAGAQAMHAAFGLKLTFCFALAPGEYHTNVVLAQLASKAVIIAPDGFADPAAADAIAQVYAPHVVSLSRAQKKAFAANAIALDATSVWMSSTAQATLEAAQHQTLAQNDLVVRHVDLSEIEKAGGSLRCCVGEIF